MINKSVRRLIFAGLVSLSTISMAQTASTASLQYLGKHQILTQERFNDVLIGGLSGITYDEKEQLYYAISDARNTEKEGLARFYTLKIDISANGINKLDVIEMHNLLDAEGQPWKKGQVDAEGIALLPSNEGFYWSSELGSSLRIADKQGNYIADLDHVIPEYYSTATQDSKTSQIGIRSGLGFEGLSVTPDNKTLFIAVETALRQDGPIATTLNSSATRILKYRIDPKTQALSLAGEYIYNLDPIPQISQFGISDNGLSEALAIDEHRLIIIERAGRNASKGYDDWDFNIRAYLVDLRESSNIQGTASLKNLEPSTLHPAKKQLLIDFNKLTDKPDCIEGVTFGPHIDGKKTLLFVSDNNFQPYQATKFFLFRDDKGLLN